MSNLMCIQSTKFCNLNVSGQYEESSFGFRAYDDYDSMYYNMVSEGELSDRSGEVFDVEYIINNVGELFTGETKKRFESMLDSALDKGCLSFNGGIVSIEKIGNEFYVKDDSEE